MDIDAKILGAYRRLLLIEKAFVECRSPIIVIAAIRLNRI